MLKAATEPGLTAVHLDSLQFLMALRDASESRFTGDAIMLSSVPQAGASGDLICYTEGLVVGWPMVDTASRPLGRGPDIPCTLSTFFLKDIAHRHACVCVYDMCMRVHSYMCVLYVHICV